MLENHLEENGNDLPPIEDITTIPEEASEELREEEEAAALEAALRTPDGGTISTEIEKPSTATIMQEWVQKVPLSLIPTPIWGTRDIPRSFSFVANFRSLTITTRLASFLTEKLKNEQHWRSKIIFHFKAWIFNCKFLILYIIGQFKIEKKKNILISYLASYGNEIVKDRFVSIVAALYAPPQRKLQPPLKSQRFSTSLHWSDQRRRSRRATLITVCD